MIKLLEDEEKAQITKKDIIDMEAKIIVQFGFELNFPGPYAAMERFLRLLGHDKNDTIVRMAYQISKFSLNEATFLDFQPSQIAASAAIISANIYIRDAEKFKQLGVFKKGEEEPVSDENSFFKISPHKSGDKGKPLLMMNTDIWNNSEVVQVSGYTIE